jgi:hypothetical protein
MMTLYRNGGAGSLDVSAARGGQGGARPDRGETQERRRDRPMKTVYDGLLWGIVAGGLIVVGFLLGAQSHAINCANTLTPPLRVAR